ncbi:MAG: UMP kinase [Oscillospiraceae bacterium]|jgi:uridylate kinase|nr:UMP kinase [Oscillospiraceae bacterium]
MRESGYTRVLLKLSGEYLAGAKEQGVDFEAVKTLAAEVKECQSLGVQFGIVVGGGNFWRGKSISQMDRARADYVGMLATAMNATVLYDIFLGLGVSVKLQMVVSMPDIAESYVRDKAVKYLNHGAAVIFGGGTGSPYFSTDTAAALKAIDIGADVIFKATHSADGVYDKDPAQFPEATRYNSLKFNEVFQNNLEIMDLAAVALCVKHRIPVLVFGVKDPKNITRAVRGQGVGTLINV